MKFSRKMFFEWSELQLLLFTILLIIRLFTLLPPGTSVKDVTQIDLGITCAAISYASTVVLYRALQILMSNQHLLTTERRLIKGFFTLMKNVVVGFVMSLKSMRMHGVLFMLRQKFTLKKKADDQIQSLEKMSTKYSDL